MSLAATERLHIKAWLNLMMSTARDMAPTTRAVNQLTCSSTGLSRKLKFLPTGIGNSTFRRDENWPMANSHPSWM